MKKINKRGVGMFDALLGLAIGAAVFFITIALLQLVMTQVGDNDTISDDGNASAAVSEGQEGIADLPGWGKIGITVGVTVVIIGLVMALRQQG